MNERDFDKLIAKKLNEQGSYPNIETNWEKVKDKMTQLQTSESSIPSIILPPNVSNNYSLANRRLLSFLLSIVALLVGLNVWFAWYVYHYTSNVQAGLTSQNLYSQHDTIVLTKVIYRVDTIYKTVTDYSYSSLSTHGVNDSLHQSQYITTGSYHKPVLYENTVPKNTIKKIATNTIQKSNNTSPISNTVKNKEAVSNTQQPLHNITTPAPLYAHDNTQNIQTETKPSDGYPPSVQTDLERMTMKQPIADSVKKGHSISQITSIISDTIKYAPLPYDSLELKPTESLQNIIKTHPKKITIGHYSIGFQTGVAEEIPSIKGYSPSLWLGIIGSTTFNNRLRLSLSCDISTFEFTTTMRDPLLYVPNDPPMTENYTLKYIEGETQSIQAGVGLTYLLRHQSRIMPMVSVAYMHRWVLPYEAEFEFKNHLTGEEKSYNVSSEKRHHDDWLSMGVGVAVNLSRKLEVQVKGDYIYDPNHGSHHLNQFLLRGGVFYKF